MNHQALSDSLRQPRGRLWLWLILWVGSCVWAGAAGGPTNSAPVAVSAPPAGIYGSQQILKLNDSLVVSVFDQPELTTKVIIDNQGLVVLPLIGSVKVGGLPLAQATAQVQNLYGRDYLVDPKVTIQIDQLAILRFTILGQAQRPGTYDFPRDENLNLLDAIAMAGGYTRLALRSSITLQRNVSGEVKIFKLDAEAMAKDQKNPPFRILPGDTITVEERIF